MAASRSPLETRRTAPAQLVQQAAVVVCRFARRSGQRASSGLAPESFRFGAMMGGMGDVQRVPRAAGEQLVGCYPMRAHGRGWSPLG
jgi:hypothetical protein